MFTYVLGQYVVSAVWLTPKPFRWLAARNPLNPQGQITQHDPAELRSCVKVEVAVLGSPSLTVLCGRKATMNLNPHFQSESLSSRQTDRQTDRDTERDRERETDRQRAGGRGEKGQREKEVAGGGGGGGGAGGGGGGGGYNDTFL